MLRCFSSGPSPLWCPARGFRIQTLVSVLKQRKRNLPDRPIGSDLDCSTGGRSLRVKRKRGLGSEAFRHSLAPHLLPQLCRLPFFVPQTLHQKRAWMPITSLQGCVHANRTMPIISRKSLATQLHTRLMRKDYQKRGTMVNQQETQFIRPEGTQGASPIQGFVNNCSGPTHCCWIAVERGVLANTKRKSSESWKPFQSESKHQEDMGQFLQHSLHDKDCELSLSGTHVAEALPGSS